VSGPGSADERRARVAELAARVTGRRVADVTEIPAGLGARRFLRVRLAGGAPASLIARIEAPTGGSADAAPPEPPLEPIRGLLERCELPVPARFGGDDEAGIDLLEDLGDTSLEQAVAGADSTRRSALYREAVDLVPRLQAVPPVDPTRVAAFARRLDAELIASKARKWLEWTLPAARGRAATPAEREATQRAFAVVAKACASAPARLAHRDLKAANVHVGPDPGAPAGRRLVLIDLQGAFMAPPEYDLVCLLRDSHVPLPEDEVSTHLEHVRPDLPDAPPADVFARRFDLLTVSRVAKDVSHYVDAATTRGDDRYLRFVATGLRNLRRAARNAADRDAELARFAEHVGEIPLDFAERLAERLAASRAASPPQAPGDPTCAP